ncbi:MAG: ParA family protein [Micromonosporaceae bacterium]
MRDDGMREERENADGTSETDHNALTESQARIRRTLDAAVSRETGEEADLPRQRWASQEAGVEADSVPAQGAGAAHAAGGWEPAIGRASVVSAYQDEVPAGAAGGYGEPYTDVVSRETPPVEDEPPLALEARRAMHILNPSGEATLPRPSKRRVICIANQKGGVGKTTTAVNLAVSLALHGNRVLVVDLDPQGNASTGLGVEHHAGTPSIYECLLDEIKLSDVAKPVEGIPSLTCAPATIDLAGAEIELVSIVARESRLTRAIDSHEGELDYVFIDCPPSLGLLTVNALVAAEEVLIPIQCEYYALEGLGQLLRNIELVKAHLNPRLRVSTILLTMYDRRTKLADQVEQEVRSHFKDVVLDTVIPRSVRVSEAPGYGQSVMTYDPGSRGATSYFGAAQEIAAQGLNSGEN